MFIYKRKYTPYPTAKQVVETTKRQERFIMSHQRRARIEKGIVRIIDHEAEVAIHILEAEYIMGLR